MQNDRTSIIKRTTILGGVVNVFVCVIKLIVGKLTQSHALIADGFHSLADLLVDALVVFTASYSGAEPDADHPYGHGRIETVATVVLALILMLTGVFIAYDSLSTLYYQQIADASYYALWVALFAIVIKEITYRYTLIKAEAIDSNLLRANAWHHRSDVASSLLVLIGIFGGIMGYPILDPIAAVIVAILIAKMGIQITLQSISELIDTAADPETCQAISLTIFSVPGVLDIHQLRTRSMSGDLLVDVHILVSPTLTVSEGHYIGHAVHEALKQNHSKIKDVTVHIDPEDDEMSAPSGELPSREFFIAELTQYIENWPQGFSLDKSRLHYLNGKCYLEIILPYSFVKADYLEKVVDALRQAQRAIPQIAKIELLFQYDLNRNN